MKEAATRKRKMPICSYDLQALNEARLKKGLSTNRLAAIVQTRFGQAAPRNREVYYIMAGERNFPNPEYIIQIAEVLDVDPDNLVTTCTPNM